MEKKSVHVYRAEQAHMLMKEGDPEPPHLYTSAVLRVTKSEIMKKSYIDQDPLKALVILKSSSLNNIIHNIGLDPIFVHYWTNHQLHVYKRYALENDACLFIDATGSIIKRICKADGSMSRHMFLYHGVINCKNGQFSIFQMISENHNANSIHFWLAEWLRLGAPVPKEVVCDSSRALLIAIIRAFTNYNSIEDYSDSLKNASLPNCYVRIDVAHFIKIYSTILKSLNKRIKTFYMSAIGQLILCRNITNARDILTSIFTLALSETDGNNVTGLPTKCDQERTKLINLIATNTTFENFEIDNNKNNSAVFEIEKDADDITTSENSINFLYDNSWTAWGKKILNDVKSSIKSDEGDRINPHYFPSIINHLMIHIRLLPLWNLY